MQLSPITHLATHPSTWTEGPHVLWKEMWTRTRPSGTEITSFHQVPQFPGALRRPFPSSRPASVHFPENQEIMSPSPRHPPGPGGWAERGHFRLWLRSSDPRHQVEAAASVIFSFPLEAPARPAPGISSVRTGCRSCEPLFPVAVETH